MRLKNYFWDRMSEWIPEKQPSDFNQAMMELGALVCVPIASALLRMSG